MLATDISEINWTYFKYFPWTILACQTCTSAIQRVKECQIYNKEILNISDFNYHGKM